MGRVIFMFYRYVELGAVCVAVVGHTEKERLESFEYRGSIDCSSRDKRILWLIKSKAVLKSNSLMSKWGFFQKHFDPKLLNGIVDYFYDPYVSFLRLESSSPHSL